MNNRAIAGVVIPCFNYGDKVERAIRSIMAQTLTNFRCVIVDDGSTDNTREAVNRVISGDSRFFYIHQDNAGVASARNRGVFSEELGRPKYIVCLDADDALDPEFLDVCVHALEDDRGIDIAYTGLYFITPDGREGLSEWPGEYNYDQQLEGRNQLPTCNLARFEVWERLGGQRQRYAVDGAGEEDAEMWLRAGAYGFRAKKVTNRGLFIYSWLSGRVSGNKQHVMTDYRSWHPWVKDRRPPFASIATPEGKFSHPVRQYDEPAISVIIPVGPGHERHVVDALDSLDAQTFRKWEACVWWDSPDLSNIGYIQRTFPHIRLRATGEAAGGAGRARNLAVKLLSRAPLLVFLDADDWLMPEALQSMYAAWTRHRKIAYTDYYGLATIDRDLAANLELERRLVSYNRRSGNAVIAHKAFEFDCNRAIVQPDPKDMYIWGLVTMLVPRKWHDHIGGFDESMKSWEDWDYQIRLARAGKCFTRIPESLVSYRFATGNRRDAGLRVYADLVKYMTDKYSRSRKPMCGCRGSQVTAEPTMTPQRSQDAQPSIVDGDLVLIRYSHPNAGQHRVIGGATGMDYGYRGGGEEFLVHAGDVAVMPSVFIQIESIPGASHVSSEDDQDDTPVDLPAPPVLEEIEHAPLEEKRVKRGRKAKS